MPISAVRCVVAQYGSACCSIATGVNERPAESVTPPPKRKLIAPVLSYWQLVEVPKSFIQPNFIACAPVTYDSDDCACMMCGASCVPEIANAGQTYPFP